MNRCIVGPYKSAAMALAAFFLSFKVKTVKKLKNGTKYLKLCTAQFHGSQALFTRREGNPFARITLALAHFFFFYTTCLQGR